MDKNNNEHSEPETHNNLSVDPSINSSPLISSQNTQVQQNAPLKPSLPTDSLNTSPDSIQESTSEHIVHESGHFESIPSGVNQSNDFAEPVQPIQGVVPKKTKNWKKIIGISLVSFLGLTTLVLAGYFGYLFYINSSDARILNQASKNILNANNLKIDFRIGFSGISVKGIFFVDKDQDIKGKLDSDLMPLEAIYMKSTDTAYIQEPSYTDKTNTNELIEYKNVYKAIEKYGLNEFGIDSINPNKNYFNAANIKYFKRVGEEKIDGKNLYKYSFEPDQKAKEEGLRKANEAIKKIDNSSYASEQQVKEFNTKIDIWIGKNDFKVYKVEGETDGSYEYQRPDSSYCYNTIKSPGYEVDYNDKSWDDYDKKMEDCLKNPKKTTENQKFSFEWALNFDYSYGENIELPKEAKISDSIDLINIEGGGQSSSEKTKVISDGKIIQTALETYFVDNNKYPSTLDEIKNDKYISVYKEMDFSNFEYKVTEGGYTIVVKYKGEKIDELRSI